MTLPVSGAISFNNINVELGVAGTTQASLGQSSYRTLAGVASGAISMSNFYGKSNRAAVSYTFSANATNTAINVSTLSGYAAGTTDVTITVASGVYVYSTSTGSYALNLSGGTTGDTITLVNNGFIAGKGGDGRGGTYQTGNPGGPAINIGTAINVTINNTNASAYIGGGGGSGGASNAYNNYVGSGGGAGGGDGGRNYGPTISGGGPGSVGANGIEMYYSGGAGGRIFPGVGGAAGSRSTNVFGYGGGAGGGGACGYGYAKYGPSRGGGGGGWGASGGLASTEGGNLGSGGAGGSGSAAGGDANPYAPATISGGAGGKAVNLNGKSVTWTSGDTTRVYGAIS